MSHNWNNINLARSYVTGPRFVVKKTGFVQCASVQQLCVICGQTITATITSRICECDETDINFCFPFDKRADRPLDSTRSTIYRSLDFNIGRVRGFNLIFYWTFPSRDEMKGSSPALRRNKSATCPCRKLSSNRAPANYSAPNWYPTDQLYTAVDIWRRKTLPYEYV